MKRAVGVCYYPEHWSEDIWAEDARRMVEAGISYVRIGEFAWTRIEPVPGELKFHWLDQAIETLGAAGLKVVLGTPTATPPRWMINRHPDMLAVTEDDQPRKFGSRRHYCFSHLGYREESARITEILAKRYGDNPYIAAWQTDNEYGCHDTILSWSDAARTGFRLWLNDRYGTIEALNEAWGNVFWSMEYRSFDEVDVPNQMVTQANPAHLMAFRRYSSDQVVAFNKVQVDILRAHSDAPILHNYMGRVTAFDHYKVGTDLDAVSWDSYPIGFLSDRLEASPEHKSKFLRQGDPDFQAFHHDIYRTAGRGRWWVMEQQPGPVNWGNHNAAPLPGMVRLWGWEAFAHGAEVVSYFRWRQAPWAQEQMHAGLLRPDSEAAPGLAKAAQVASEIAELPEVGESVAEVGLVFDYESCWAWETLPQGEDFDYFRLVFDFYRALRKRGLSVDILRPDMADLSGYKFVLAPGLFNLSDELRSAIEAYDGEAVFGPRFNSKTDEFAIPVPLPPNLPGLDCRVTAVESLPPSELIRIEGGGAMRSWFEHLEGDAETGLMTVDGKVAGKMVGNACYIAGWPDELLLERLVEAHCLRAGIETTAMPDGLRQRDCGAYRFTFNYAQVPVSWQGEEIEPAGVRWQRRA